MLRFLLEKTGVTLLLRQPKLLRVLIIDIGIAGAVSLSIRITATMMLAALLLASGTGLITI